MRRVRNFFLGRNTMHELRHGIYNLHQKAAQYHDLSAHAHRTAAEHNEKGDNENGDRHLERALEHSERVYKLAREAHSKSGRMGTFS
jgi:hypothetical protein